MSIRPHRSKPCWQVVRVATGEPPEADYDGGWAHYDTMAEAQADLAERQADYEDDSLTVAQSFPGPCVGLFCDCPECGGKGEPIDCSGEGWTHLDPSDPTPFQWDDVDVTEADDGKHYCNVCMIGWPWCDECDEQHPGDCPAAVSPSPLCIAPDGTMLDVPLFEADS